MIDLLIKNGTVVDGTGAPGRTADVAIDAGRIVAVDADLDLDAREVVDASGYLVTPGFIDVHTHYDGQVTWDDALLPTAAHGVTTLVMGACGIGFAPVRPGSEDWLVRLMEGVEDIPGTALHVGIPWGWETFPEFLDFIDQRSYAVDVAAHLPHSAVRAYVLGERAKDDAPATEEELQQIAAITREAIEAGAVGVGTSRMIVHRASDGGVVPGTTAPEEELLAIANAVRDGGGGVMQVLPSGGAGGVEGQEGEAMRSGLTGRDKHTVSAEVEMMRRLHRASGQAITFTLADNPALGKEEFERARSVVAEANAAGEQIRPQFAPRPVGGIVTLDTYHPFMARPTYQKIAHLPVEERAKAMSDPETRAAILGEDDAVIDSGDPRKHTHATLQRHLANIYDLSDLDYEPDPDTSIARRAELEGRDPLEVMYDGLIADDGHAVFIWLATGYTDGNLDTIGEFIEDPNYVMALGDGGAHVLFICDASFPTFLLSHWGRKRSRGRTFPVELLIKKLTKETGELYGFDDRGVIEEGKRADINIIDFESLDLGRPHLIDDLPTGARRFMQLADGYKMTIVNGVVTRRDGADTGERPGRLVRNGSLS